MEESIYKLDIESKILENRTDYDIYRNNIEQKEDKYNNSFEFIRYMKKSKAINFSNFIFMK